MATDKEFQALFMTKMHSDNIRTRKMMGEYMIYYDDIVVGGLYDNKLLLKATKHVLMILQNYSLVEPYPNAKKMVRVPDFNDREKMMMLFENIKADLKAKP